MSSQLVATLGAIFTITLMVTSWSVKERVSLLHPQTHYSYAYTLWNILCGILHWRIATLVTLHMLHMNFVCRNFLLTFREVYGLPHGMSILKYLLLHILHSGLPNLNGPSSSRISPAAILSANEEVRLVLIR